MYPPLVLSGTIAPTRLSLLYRVGLVVVAIGMLLLPSLYLTVVVGAAAVVWWHLTANAWILSGSGGVQWRFLAYVAPAVIGVAVVFFMVKPVLARPAKRKDPVVLSPTEELDLFAFIQQICRQVRAPMPRCVHVDCQVNASASFLPGRLSTVRRDLVLTIGLPLVVGLSVRELGGVLAHEFGHFAQGGGMRLTTFVRGINHWFARVVYERDHWDERLEEWSTEGDGRAGIIFAIARGCVWLSRRLLFGLMMAGHAISCFMLRQMEYDADSYEIKFAGSEAFVRTSARMRELNVAVQFGYDDLRHSWRRRALPADFPSFVVERVDRMPQDLRAQVHRVPDATTGLLDTHPSDADRSRVAEAEASPGIVVGADDSAALLLRNFEALSAAATRHHYTHELGLDLEAVTLVGLGEAVQGSRRRQEAHEAVAEFFDGCLSTFRPLRLPLQEALCLGDAERPEALVKARDTMVALTEDLAVRYRRFEWLALRHTQAFAAEELLASGIAISNGEDFELAEATLEGAASTRTWALEQQQLETSALERFEATAAERLVCGLALAAQKSQSVNIQSLCEVINAVGGVIPHIHDADRFLTTAAILARVGAGHDAAVVANRLQLLGGKVDTSLAHVRSGLSDLACPQELTTEPITAVAWCGLSPPGTASGPEVVDRTLTFYLGLLGQIVTIARAGEASIGQSTEGLRQGIQ